MPTPTGTISLSDVNDELGNNSTAQISMNDSDVRELAGLDREGDGTISMDNLRGMSAGQDPWYIAITGDNNGSAWNVGGIIVDEVTTERGDVLSVLSAGNPGSVSGGKNVFSSDDPTWAPSHFDIETNMSNKAAFYYVGDGSSYVQVVTREFTWDYDDEEVNWYNDFVNDINDEYEYRVNFTNSSYNVTGGSVSDIGSGTYANPSPTPGGTGAAHTGKPYNIATLTWNGTYTYAGQNGMALVFSLGYDYEETMF